MDAYTAIEGVSRDLSRKFGSGDVETTGSGDTAMLRRELFSLWSLSGLPIETFMDRVEEAATKTAEGDGSLSTFLVTFKDVLGDQDLRRHAPPGVKVSPRTKR